MGFTVLLQFCLVRTASSHFHRYRHGERRHSLLSTIGFTLTTKEMSAATFNSITLQISLYAPCILLIVGNVGCILNFVTFTAKQLRRNSCGWYFLMSAVNDLFILNFGLITKLLSDYFGIDPHNRSRIYCKFRIYISWVVPCISTSYLVLAALDRCLSTSSSTRARSFSKIRIARRLTILPVVVYSLTSSHQLFYFDLRPTCLAQSGGYSIFISIYSIFWTSLVPQTLLVVFGLLTYKHIRSSRKRLLRETIGERNRTDAHLIKMTFIQVIVSSILLNVRSAYYSYYAITSDMRKGPRQLAFEAMLLQISSFVFYTNFAVSFYSNTLMSQLFRQIFVKRLLFGLRWIRQAHPRIHPAGTHRMEH